MKDSYSQYTDEDLWCIKEDGFDKEIQSIRESQFTIGNGFMGTRGVLEELPEGAHPGTYVLKNNTIAYNMWNPAFSSRNYAMLVGYPNDDTGISAEISLTLINNIFAFNTGPQVGTPTGIYLGSGVNLVEEGNNLFWSREDGEIQAEFVPGKSWFSRSDIGTGNWQQLTGQGKDDICVDPTFVSEWPEADLHLSSQSPAVDKGRREGAPKVDLECMFRPAGGGPDIGAYERNSYLDPDCGAQLKKIIKKSPIRR